ncbi:MAG: OmpA family protein [Blastochloris sp.]|nr:OmpA family protein [Blastochloris sp.]
MKIKLNQYRKPPYQLLLTATLSLCCVLGISTQSIAQTSMTETTTTISTTATLNDIAAQELALKEKKLELEKALLIQEKTQLLDVQKAELALEIKKLELLKARRDLMVRETEAALAMELSGDVLFDVAKFEIKEMAEPTLRQVALLLGEYPKGSIVVTGYADSTGKAQDNLELSRKRAEAVKTYLLNKSNVSSERVIAKGVGETKPAASNTSMEGRQLNRRVEITLAKPSTL